MRLTITTYLLIALGAIITVPLYGQIFPCDGSFYISLNDPTSNGPTTFYKIETDGSTANFIPITSASGVINGIAYNPFDNFIYGVENTISNDVIRVRSDGTREVAYTISAVPVWFGSGSDIRYTDTTFISQNADEDALFLINLNTNSLTGIVPLYWDPASGNSGTANIFLDDVAVDPTDPATLYTYQRNYVNGGEPVSTRGHLLKVDIEATSPTYGQVSVIGQIPSSIALHLGSFFFDRTGQLYGYGSVVPPPVQQERFIIIDKTTASAELIAQGPVATGNDGCYCPFYIDLEKTVTVENYCDSAIITFEITVINNSLEDIGGMTIRDTLPDGFTIAEVFPEDGDLGASLLVSQSPPVVTLSNASLPVDSSATFTIRSFTQVNGNYANQAWIDDLPARYGSQLPSDDTATYAFDDATAFTVDLPQTIHTGTMDISLCAGEQITINGETYDVPGMYEQLLPNAAMNGCDSLLQIEVTLDDPGIHQIEAELCDGESLAVNGIFYTEPGTYDDIIPNGAANGCDSIILINITGVSATLSFFDNTLCAGNTIVVNGKVYEAPGSYSDTIPSGAANGCDSILMINITGGTFVVTSIDTILCTGVTLLINGAVYSTPGSYSDTIPGGAASGCDSILMIGITSGENSETLIEEIICSGDEIVINGLAYGAPGLYQDVIPGGATNGCDSLLEIVINELELSAGMLNVMLCPGDTFTLHNNTYTASTDDTVALANAASNGCDSLIYLRIGMHPTIEIQYLQHYDISLGDSAYIEIQTAHALEVITWTPDVSLSCATCLSLWASPSVTTSYNFNVTDINGCTASGTVFIQVDASDVGIYIPNIFSPNQDGINDRVTIYGPQIGIVNTFMIFDRWGEVAWEGGPFSPNVPAHGWDGTWNGEPMQPGVYIYKATVELMNGDIRTLTGDVTLIR